MGREGVAYSFVTPEEGHELTRIEMRINRLLVRQETGDLLPHRPKPIPAPAAAAAPPIEPPVEEPLASTPAVAVAPRPVFGRRSHRYRRAL
jgi:ATP-dependent RNA helicase DeaD